MWLARSIGADKKFMHATTRGQVSNRQVLRSWATSAKSATGLRVGGFCAVCNNGWMARIEEGVKPLVLAIRGRSHFQLTRADQKRLARWAYLKALVFSLATPDVRFPTTDFSRFHAQRTPPHASVVLLCASDISLPGANCQVDPLDLTPKGECTVWRTTLWTGHALIQVFSDRKRAMPPSNRPVVRSDMTFARIWTPQDRVTWPPRQVLTSQAVADLLDYYDYRPEQTDP